MEPRASSTTDLEKQLTDAGVDLPNLNWEGCRKWLDDHSWKINSLSDYPRGEIKLAVRNGFERISVSGFSDLEVMVRAILEIQRREKIHA